MSDPVIVNVNVSGTTEETIEFSLNGTPPGVTITSPRQIEFTPPLGSGSVDYQVTFTIVEEDVSYADPALEFNPVGISPDTDTSVTMMNTNDIPPDGEKETIHFDMRLQVPAQNAAFFLPILIDDPTIVNNPCGGASSRLNG